MGSPRTRLSVVLADRAYALIPIAGGITISFNAAAIGAIIAATVAAYPSWRLLRATRAKVVAEAGKAADDRVLAYSDRIDRENAALRQRVAQLEDKLEGAERRCEHRCDVLERLLIEHGIPVPGM
jgi:hypothetical protein